MDPDNMFGVEDDVLGEVEPEKAKSEEDKKDSKSDKTEHEEEMDTVDQSRMDWNVEIDEKERADEEKKGTKKSDKGNKTKEIKKKMDKMKERNKEMLGDIASLRLKEAWQLDKATYQGKDQARKRLAGLKTFLDKEVKAYYLMMSYINYTCYMVIGTAYGRI